MKYILEKFFEEVGFEKQVSNENKSCEKCNNVMIVTEKKSFEEVKKWLLLTKENIIY